MKNANRRAILKGVTLGAGSLAFSPFIRHLHASEQGEVPKRFVFVLKSSGLQGEYLNPEGLSHGTGKLVDAPLADYELPSGLVSLEPLKDKLTIIQGLSGKMTRLGHSAHYGALGGYKASPHAPPLDATIDGHLSESLPSVFNHVGFKMGEGNQGVTFPAISAKGKGQQLPFQQNPMAAFENLFGSILEDGDLKKKYTRTGNVLDAMSDDIRRLQQSLPSSEKEKLGHYLNGFESLRDRRVKLVGMQELLRKNAPDLNDKYTSRFKTHHLEAHFDMAAASLICGLTNVITVHADGLDSVYTGIGIGNNVHAIGHGAGYATLTAQDCRNAIRSFHLELIASLAMKLNAVPEGNGTMLDNTIIVYTSDNAAKHHSVGIDWPMLVIGNLGGKLKSNGRYLAYPHYGHADHRYTICNWFTTLCHLAGIPQDLFGQPDMAIGRVEDQSGPLSELLA
ncbi:MAG: DUF1552 domain-containing protein [Rubripirellula sp.]|jgi:hypothetical protein|nr:DUF1552 domain-containing protein [Rubripirellula sp.]